MQRGHLRTRNKVRRGRIFLIDSFTFLSLTGAFCSATNRRKTSSLVVSLLTNCIKVASEAADLPGRAGLLSRQECCQATPHHPGR